MAQESNFEHETASPPYSSDAAAWAVLSAASRGKADAFIDEQTILTRLQAKEVAHELHLRHWQMRFSNVSSVLKLSFEIAMALIVLSFVALIAGAVWSAAHDDGLVIEAFSVPPDLASRGMTGEVIAGRVLDKIAMLQSQTDSMRPTSSYTNNWGDDIKVQIPDAGVSVGELNHYLHQWLGHQTHISGDVVHAGNGLTITARVGANSAESFSGSEADPDALVARTAEAIYAHTQPYRYSVYLLQRNEPAKAIAVLSEDAKQGEPSERGWAYLGLLNALIENNRVAEAAKYGRAAVAMDPNSIIDWVRAGETEQVLGRAEAALADYRAGLRAVASGRAETLQKNGNTILAQNLVQDVDDLTGDFTAEVDEIRAMQAIDTLQVVTEGMAFSYAGALAKDHDLAGARLVLANMGGLTTASTSGQGGAALAQLTQQNIRGVELFGAFWNENWTRLLDIARKMDVAEPKLDALNIASFYSPAEIWPYLARAEAMTGDMKGAHALIDRTPLDCDICLRTRAEIDVAQRNLGGAAFWFAYAIKQAPSSPFACDDWGAMLLREGRYDEAIAMFKVANAKGPHFADPLEMWGEALMQENRSDLALAKFEEAAKYAPHWGRLHLEWGKALFYAGKRADAEKQFALVSALDLSQADKVALESWDRAHD